MIFPFKLVRAVGLGCSTSTSILSDDTYTSDWRLSDSFLWIWLIPLRKSNWCIVLKAALSVLVFLSAWSGDLHSPMLTPSWTFVIFLKRPAGVVVAFEAEHNNEIFILQGLQGDNRTINKCILSACVCLNISVSTVYTELGYTISKMCKYLIKGTEKVGRSQRGEAEEMPLVQEASGYLSSVPSSGWKI